MSGLAMVWRFGKGPKERQTNLINSMQTKIARSLRMCDPTENLFKRFKDDLIVIEVLSGVENEVAKAVEKALIECYGRNNCVNVLSGSTKIQDPGSDVMHRLVFDLMTTRMTERYNDFLSFDLVMANAAAEAAVRLNE